MEIKKKTATKINKGEILNCLRLNFPSLIKMILYPFLSIFDMRTTFKINRIIPENTIKEFMQIVIKGLFQYLLNTFFCFYSFFHIIF